MSKSDEPMSHGTEGYQRGVQRVTLYQLDYQLDIRREEMQRTLAMREKLHRLLLWAFGGSLAFTFMIILFEGWHVGGFNIPDGVIYALVVQQL
jgi:hypothetical protein